MRGVMANIAHLNERERSPIWKDEGWKKVISRMIFQALR